MTREATFLAADVCHATGCTYRQLDYWCRTGKVPGHVPARGHGSRRRFTRAQLEHVGRLTAESARRRVPILEAV